MRLFNRFIPYFNGNLIHWVMFLKTGMINECFFIRKIIPTRTQTSWIRLNFFICSNNSQNCGQLLSVDNLIPVVAALQRFCIAGVSLNISALKF